MLSLLLNYLVLISFAVIFATELFGKIPQRFLCVLLLTVFLPPCVSFYKSPTISPHHLLLYGFFVFTFADSFNKFKSSIVAFPIKIPLLLLLVSLCATAIFSGEGAKGIYNAFRSFMETYSYIFLAFICGAFYKEINLWNRFFIPIIIIVILGLIELIICDNVFFRIVCKAFPIYDGFLNLDGLLSMGRSYRTRIFITTLHPSTLGAMSCCAILALTSQIKNLEWTKIKKIIAFTSLGLILFFSGSRSGQVCCLVCLLILVLHRFHIAFKIISIGLLCFFIAFSANKIIEKFSVEGQGSTISMRQEQLLFSYIYFLKSPIFGNGIKYTTKTIMERDTYNNRVTDVSIGGLESIFFYQLIDCGLIGVIVYFLFFFCCFIYFFRRRELDYAKTGFIVMFAFFIFALMSGEMGGNNVLAYLLGGFCMGAVHKQEIENGNDNKDKE